MSIILKSNLKNSFDRVSADKMQICSIFQLPSMLVSIYPVASPSVSHSGLHVPDESTCFANGQSLPKDYITKIKIISYHKMWSEAFRSVDNHRESEGVETNGLGRSSF